MFHKKVDSIQTRQKKTSENLSVQTVETIAPCHSPKSKNKYFKTYGQRLRERMTTVFCCVCIIVFGIAFLTKADPITTSIGENISTNDLSLSGSVLSGSWAGTAIDIAHGGTGQDWSTATQGSFLYFSDTGILSTLSTGTAGQFLQSGGDGADPSWANVTRSATFVIAASDSSTLSKQQADYVCDGVDDQVEIQAAIDALPAVGGTIIMREGVYSISAYVTISSNVTLLGYGNAKIIDAVYIGELLYVLDATNVTVDGIHINVTKTSGGTTNGFGIYINNSNNVTIKNSNIEGTSNTTPTWGVAGKNSNYITFDSNYVSGIQYEALSFWWNVNHSIMSNNIMVENGFGMVIERESSYNTLIGNTITNSNLTTGDILVRNAHHNSVTGNTIKNNFSLTYKQGVAVENFSHDNVISGNTLVGLYDSIAIKSGSQGNTISNNNIIGKINNGIYLLTQNNQVIGNTISYANSGIYVSGGTSNNISNNKIVGNIGANGNAAIHLSGGSNNTIRGNDILFSTGYGIRFVGTSESNIIENNTIADDYSLVAAILGVSANSGDTNITISADPCNLSIGQKIIVGGEVLTITGYYNPSATPDTQYPRTFTVTPALASNHSSGVEIAGNNAMTNGIVLLDGSVTNNIIRNNVIRNASSHSIYYNQSKGAITFFKNIGYTTENSGTSTIATDATSIVVTHGLAATPTRVQLTPTTDTAGKRYWISAKTATTFTITIDTSHTSDISFDWRAVVGEGN